MAKPQKNLWRPERLLRSRDVIAIGADMVDMQFNARGWGVEDTALITMNVTRKIRKHLTKSPWQNQLQKRSVLVSLSIMSGTCTDTPC